VHLSDYCHVQRVQDDSTPEMAMAVAAFTRDQLNTRGPPAFIQATEREVRAWVNCCWWLDA
jgi:hypothetical protein